MHDGMPYDPIQGQGQVKVCEVPKIALFQLYLLRYLQWQLANDHHQFLNYSTISKFVRAGFSIFVLVVVSRDLKLGAVPAVSPSTKKFFSRFQ